MLLKMYGTEVKLTPHSLEICKVGNLVIYG